MDAGSAHPFADALMRAAEGDARTILLDLSAVPAVSSAGLDGVTRSLPRVLERLSLEVVGVDPRVGRLFRLAGLPRVIERRPSPSDAELRGAMTP